MPVPARFTVYRQRTITTKPAPLLQVIPTAFPSSRAKTLSCRCRMKTFPSSRFVRERFPGYSPRMRFDLVVNTMFKFALTDGVITVNNPAIWLPSLPSKTLPRLISVPSKQTKPSPVYLTSLRVTIPSVRSATSLRAASKKIPGPRCQIKHQTHSGLSKL